jgi:hypothetical protein
MRTIETMVYKFDELSDETKEKVLEKLADINVDGSFDWWKSTYEDAERIGLKITGFDIDRGNYCEGKFVDSAENIAMAILKEHGESCETVETANQYLFELEHLRDPYSDENKDNEDFDADDVDTEDIDAEFLRMLCEDYRIMLKHEYEYLTSEEVIIETIQANEYEFLANGKLA